MLNRRLIPLGLVTALAASTPVLAQVNLDNPLNVAKNIEAGALNNTASIVRTAAQGNAGRYGLVTVVGTNVDTISTAGIGFANTSVIYARVDITNAVFNSAVVAADLKVTNTIAVSATGITQGGATGDNFVIFDYTVNAGAIGAAFSQGTNIEFKKTAAGTIGVLGSAPVGITVKIFNDLGNATNSIAPLTSKSGTLLTFGSSLSAKSTPANPESNVSSLFTAFNAAGTSLTASLGTVVLQKNPLIPTVNPVTFAATNADLSEIGPVANASTTITGDFSFGVWSMQAAVACTAAAGAQTKLATLIATDNASAAVPTSNFTASGINRTALCVTTTAAEVVPATTAYTVSSALAPLAAVNMFPPGAQAGSYGKITRNGSTIQLPYLTTFADYNQRVTLVNRGTSDITYATTFTPETGVTAVAGTGAAGTVAAGTSLVVKASDMVTLTGKSRTAATLTVVSATGTLDVSTNQVAADGSTDTIVYGKNVL
jgi:hypothetical protein